MEFKYMRIQGKEISANTNFPTGIFRIFVQMEETDVMEEEDAMLYDEISAWFAEYLPFPQQCLNKEKVVCYFKTDNADEMIKLITPAMWLLQKYNHPFDVVYTNFPGEIVYEDRFQVVVKVRENEIVQY